MSNVELVGGLREAWLWAVAVDSNKLEYGFMTIYASFPSFLFLGIEGWSYSN